MTRMLAAAVLAAALAAALATPAAGQCFADGSFRKTFGPTSAPGEARFAPGSHVITVAGRGGAGGHTGPTGPVVASFRVGTGATVAATFTVQGETDVLSVIAGVQGSRVLYDPGTRDGGAGGGGASGVVAVRGGSQRTLLLVAGGAAGNSSQSPGTAGDVGRATLAGPPAAAASA